MRRKFTPRHWVGWREWVALPQLGIDEVKAKVDTGASTSSIHAIHIKRFQEDGRARVRFEVHPLQKRTDVTVSCVADIYDERFVTSSTGHREKRIVIRTPILVAGVEWPIELTLANRDTMGFRMLLGRSAMAGRMLVDPSASYLAGASDQPEVASPKRSKKPASTGPKPRSEK